MKLQGNISDISIDYSTGKPKLTITLTERHIEEVEELKDKLLDVELKVHRNRRSLDANAYCFVLCDQLAEKLNIPKETVYRNAIKDIGGNSDVVCVIDKAVQSLCESWQRNGLGWQTDTMPSKIKGCTNVILYYGSSTYDTAQMHRLIQILEEEAKLQGIPLRPRADIERMIEEWK